MVGTTVPLTAIASGCETAFYQFWMLPPSGQWTVLQPYSATSTYQWATSSLPSGAYTLDVWVSSTGDDGTQFDAQQTLPFTLTSAGTVCTGATLSSTDSSPQPVGTAVPLSATASGCSSPLYQFWMLLAGGQWTVLRDYSATSTYSWDTTGLPTGSYTLDVWVKDSASNAEFDAEETIPFALGSSLCAGATIQTSAASPQSSGTTITVTGGSSACGSPLYEFWLLPPGGGWNLAQAYGASDVWGWDTTGAESGAYEIGIWVKDSSSPTQDYDTELAIPFTLTASAGTCSSATLSSTDSSPQQVGTTIPLSASTSGCTGPLYQFWALAPGGQWTVLQQYSTTSTFSMATTGWETGAYTLDVWVKAPSSIADFDSQATLPFTLSAPAGVCTSTTLTSTDSSPQAVGTTIPLSATASGCGTPLYQFWVLAPGGQWTVLQGYSATNTFSMATTGWETGAYTLDVWAKESGSSAEYDTQQTLSFTLDSP